MVMHETLLKSMILAAGILTTAAGAAGQPAIAVEPAATKFNIGKLTAFACTMPTSGRQ
jgi:hypothetical protein